MRTLRSNIIRIAHKSPGLRVDLLPLLKTAGMSASRANLIEKLQSLASDSQAEAERASLHATKAADQAKAIQETVTLLLKDIKAD